MQGEYTGLLGNKHGKYPDGPILSRIEGDKRGIQYNRGTLQPTVLDLSVAQAPREYDFQGDVLYVDKLSTGTIKFRFDTSWQRGFPLGANSAVRGFPYKSVLLEWDAQPGETAVIWHGYGIEIVPPNQDITSISTVGGISTPVDIIDTGNIAETNFSSSDAIGLNAALAVFVAASNTVGATIHAAGIYSRAANEKIENLQHFTSAPTTLIDGAILFNCAHGPSATDAPSIQLSNPVRFAASRGLWFFNGVTLQAIGNRFANYTL